MEVRQEDILAIVDDACTSADVAKLKSGASLKDAGVDSLEMMNVLLGLEEKFHIKISDAEAEALTSVESIISYLQSK